jgi:hypothetical protein
MIRKILLVGLVLTLALLVMAGPAMAKVEKMQLGPYAVRFNLTRDVNITVVPTHNDTYSIDLGGEVRITVMHGSYPMLRYIDPKILRQSEERLMRGAPSNCLLTYSYNRTIDGLNGVVVTGRKCIENATIFSATYLLEDWYTLVSITSFWSWDEGTSDLIDTIHVEESK